MTDKYDIKTTFHYDDSEGRMYVKRVQDVEGIIEANKRAFHDAPRNGFKSEVMNHKARIPLVCIEEWCRVNGVPYRDMMLSMASKSGDKKLFRRFMNDPDNRQFLTRPGKV